MAELYLIRHAQASFGTSDYDRLSPLGCRQAGALGEYFRDCAIHFDAVYSGELERQRKTAKIVLGLQPDNVHHEIDQRLNEIEIDKVFEHLVPQLAKTSSILEKFGIEMGAVALQFSLRDSRISTTLCGVSSPENIQKNLVWAQTQIPSEFWDEVLALPFSTDDPEANRVYTPS